jgi:hypothetical protein
MLLFDMLTDVRLHVKKTGRKVELADDSMDRVFGYRDGDLVWRISFSEVKAAKAAASSVQQAAWAEMFHTPEGRRRLVDPVLIALQETWNQMSPPGVWPPNVTRAFALFCLADSISVEKNCEAWLIATTSITSSSKELLIERWGEIHGGESEDNISLFEVEARETIRRLIESGQLREFVVDSVIRLVPA